MKLYFSPGVCSLSPHIVLMELGLSIDLVKVDIETCTLESGMDYLRVNPSGKVPALQLEDGTLVVDGAEIVRHLVDLSPATGISSAHNAVPGARLEEWLSYISGELHELMLPLFYPSTSEEVKPAIRQELRIRFGQVCKQIEGRAYAMGREFTVVDAYLFSVLQCARFIGVDVSKWPALDAYVGRIGGRPSVIAARRAEGLFA